MEREYYSPEGYKRFIRFADVCVTIDYGGVMHVYTKDCIISVWEGNSSKLLFRRMPRGMLDDYINQICYDPEIKKLGIEYLNICKIAVNDQFELIPISRLHCVDEYLEDWGRLDN